MAAKNKQTKKKEKMVLFKNKNEAVLAVIVMILFAIACIYNISIYISEQQPPTQTNTTVSPDDPTLDPVARELAQQKAAGGASSAPGAENTSPAPADANALTQEADKAPTQVATQSQPPVQSATGSALPIIPIIIAILIAVIAAVAFKLLQKKGVESAGNEQSSSVNQQSKNKFTLAKNKNEMIAAIVVLALLAGVSIFNIVKYIQDQQIAKAPPGTPQSMEEYLAKKQQGGLESLAKQGDENAQTPSDPSAVSTDANDIYSKTLELQGQDPNAPASSASSAQSGAASDSDIAINPRGAGLMLKDRKFTSKMVTIPVSETGRSNPFLPAAENVPPSSLPKFSVLPPPESASVGSDADNVMGTTISGILYDKYSPSAIITIGGSDYLVKKGDLINRYKILSITKNEVVVQLGNNIYKAGVGELLVKSSMNFNTISNLDRKFAGNNVSINVRKKR